MYTSILLKNTVLFGPYFKKNQVPCLHTFQMRSDLFNMNQYTFIYALILFRFVHEVKSSSSKNGDMNKYITIVIKQ